MAKPVTLGVKVAKGRIEICLWPKKFWLFPPLLHKPVSLVLQYGCLHSFSISGVMYSS